MVRKNFTPEQIINRLREVEILLSQGETVAVISKKIGVSAHTYLEKAKVLIEQWRREYNQVRPHSSLGYRLPAPEAILTAVTT